MAAALPIIAGFAGSKVLSGVFGKEDQGDIQTGINNTTTPISEQEKTTTENKKKARAYLGSLEPSKGFDSKNKTTAKSFLLSY